MKVAATRTVMPHSVVAGFSEQEAQGALEVSARPDTSTVWVMDDSGKTMAYVIFGLDKGGMVTVYYARSTVKALGPMLMKQFFGVSEVLGVPMRMHAQSIRDIHVKARMFGANFCTDGVDSEGVLQGIFGHVE